MQVQEGYATILSDLYERVKARGNALRPKFNDTNFLDFFDEPDWDVIEPEASALKQLSQFEGHTRLREHKSIESLIRPTNEDSKGYIQMTQRLLYAPVEYDEQVASVSEKGGFRPISESKEALAPELKPSLEIILIDPQDMEFGFAVNPDGTIIWYNPTGSGDNVEERYAELQQYTTYDSAFEHFLDILLRQT